MTIRLLAAFLQVPPPRGAGYLTGSTAIAGAPDAPVQRLVQLVQVANARGTVFPAGPAVDWQWSGTDGAWRFDGLDPAQKYHVIAYDHTGQYDPVIKLGLVPSVE